MSERLQSPAPPRYGWLEIGGLSLLASFLTPSGWGNWLAVLNNNSRYILSRTVETMPASLTNAGTWPFALLLGLSILIFLATRKSLHVSHVFLLGGFALLGLLMARNIPLFAIASAPILSEGTSRLLERAERWKKMEANIAALERPLRGAVWPILLGLGIILFAGGRHQVQKEALAHFDARVFPVAAADWLVENPQTGNMFNEFNWGGYLLYRLWPQQKVFLDSQTDFYGEALVREYEQILMTRDGWQTTLDQRAIEWTIIPRDVPIADALQSAGWRVLYADPTAIIIRRP